MLYIYVAENLKAKPKMFFSSPQSDEFRNSLFTSKPGYGFNQPWVNDEQYIQLARKKVKYVQIVNEIISENSPEITPSPRRRHGQQEKR